MLNFTLEVFEKRGKSLQPIFITCDPARDTPKVVGLLIHSSVSATIYPD